MKSEQSAPSMPKTRQSQQVYSSRGCDRGVVDGLKLLFVGFSATLSSYSWAQGAAVSVPLPENRSSEMQVVSPAAAPTPTLAVTAPIREIGANEKKAPSEATMQKSMEEMMQETPENRTGESFAQWLQKGIVARQKGELHMALSSLLQANALAQTIAEKSLATGEIGIVLLQSKRLSDAELWLTRAYNLAGGLKNDEARFRYAMELGNVLSALNHPKLASNYYQEAVRAATPEIRLAARMNALRGSANRELGKELPKLEADLALIKDSGILAEFNLRLANLLLLDEGKRDADAFRYAKQAYVLGQANRLRRVNVGALDTLSRIYESEKKNKDGLLLVNEAIATADRDRDQDLLINLEWRRGRLLHQEDKLDQAIAAYQAAVRNIEAIRFDIPVVYNDGRSSFRETLEPIYLGLSGLLLQKANLMGDKAEPYLRMARNSAEGIKQSELQDYLGDRCTVVSAQQAQNTQLASDTAIVYPIMFDDRVETLVETSAGIRRYESKVPSFELVNKAKRFASGLRSGLLNILPQAQSLHQILLSPFEADLIQAGVKKVVVVPDGVLRLVPYPALYDGKEYALKKFAFSVTSALSLTHSSNEKRPALNILVAGLENPGPVVEVLEKASLGGNFNVAAISGQSKVICGGDDVATSLSQVQLRGISSLADAQLQQLSCQLTERVAPVDAVKPPTNPNGVQTRGIDTQKLRESLRLPGVSVEVADLRRDTNANVLLNDQFTLSNFSKALQTGAFNVVHIASHGVFGGSGDNSYLLSYDKLITMNELQSLLRSENLAGKDIEILSLSACETADGDDRAPLGISGAALKARARSALGTLWPVADIASQQVMNQFYKAYTQGESKTEALRNAQLSLLNNPATAAPFYWAPFILVGQWE